jgi:hypothetical protein
MQEYIRHEILHVRGPWASTGRGKGGAPRQGNMSGLACGYWLGKFVVGGVPLCYVINRAMRRSAWWLVADCLPCTLHVRTPPISQLPTAPPHLLFLLSAGLRVAVGAATDPYYHSLVLPRHQSTLPSPPMPSYTMLPCSPQLPTPRLPPSVFPRSSFGSTADHGHYH